MLQNYYIITIMIKLQMLIILLSLTQINSQNATLDGPGLLPFVVMPARYFILNFTDMTKNIYSKSWAEDVAIELKGVSVNKRDCRLWYNKIDRKDGSFIIRYKIYEDCNEMNINVYVKSKHIVGSPFKIKGLMKQDQCYCPMKNFDRWLEKYGCTSPFSQIESDLRNFVDVDMKTSIEKILQKYHKPESTSFCHYVIKNNQIYRKCYGKHVGFNMFSDNILLFLTRKVILPDMELVINLGDWPLVHKNSEPLPIFSWCGSEETMDIVMPTYDITEATLENMGRVSLDILSVQGGAEKQWWEREPRAFWRGRDSRSERLKLVDIARKYPHMFNVSLTNFFFFRDKEAEYGPKQPHISFFKFFDYKYQLNIDGTVAAYRFPYLLAGGGMVLKQESSFYEHFYKQLKEWEHYVPVKHDLSDLVEKVKWAMEHDNEARRIAENGMDFAVKNLLPQHIICYHALLFSEWSKRLKSPVSVSEDMTHVPQPSFACDCRQEANNHDEL